ncbi:hypothetical protein [Magnetospirillum gryphiswaldense]|uniref:hypothetical protein n=1 Tax=Magnetospirillum gryphiswaldense TaxID=55518 RepID=UPI000D02840A|nr:hypothetical protein [Magnetospirillum gryphiswaldense]AVM74231.1 hypothetical protein MSR1_17390 [Magnetospirillum gryphiswaldense MSR-1]AVM78134.1 hypothetical protein MSR1L_17390 [Magnetospirillum gryphiswaldense]
MEKDFSEKSDAWLEGIAALGTHHPDKGGAIAEIKRRDRNEHNALAEKNLRTAKIAAIGGAAAAIAAIASAVSDWIK